MLYFPNYYKQESVCKTGHAPVMLLCHSHCNLDLYLTDPKIDREHLSRTKVYKGWA